MKIKINVQDGATPEIHKLLERVGEAEGMMRNVAFAVETLVREHFIHVNERHGNKLGGPSTHFWQRAADSVEVTHSAMSAEIAISEPGVALQLHGGTVRPTGHKINPRTNKPVMFLAIPISPAAHGKTPADFVRPGLNQRPGNALYSKGRHLRYMYQDMNMQKAAKKQIAEGKPRSIATFGERLFIFVRSATIPAHPEVMPADATVEARAVRAAEAWIYRQTPAL